ncbi:MAG TPA: thiolase family protein [Stellaceae bacterium]|jgi:acetyl-CoA acetyltransferase
MYRHVEIPYGCYWSTPFARWQGSLANLHSLQLAAYVARGELDKRNIAPTDFDHAVLGMTTPQAYSFHGLPWFLSLLGAKELGGPTVSQACATGTRCVNIAADEIELGRASASLIVTCDRTSNGPLVTYLDSNGPGGGRPDDEHWILDSFFGKTPVPFANEPIVNTAENCAKQYRIDTETQHALVLRRYEQYRAALADSSAFLKRFMTLPFAVPDKKFARTVKTIDGDEGVHDTDRDKLAKLKPVTPGGTVTYAGQTHPADGNAAIVVATRERAAELSRDKDIRIEVLGIGQARAAEKMMPLAPVPATKAALADADVAIGKIDAVKSHNPFIVNDIVFARETGYDVDKINNYGCSLVWGHPHAPTATRGIIELIEELVVRGGGYGLFQGCAAGDFGMATVLRVTDARKH